MISACLNFVPVNGPATSFILAFVVIGFSKYFSYLSFSLAIFLLTVRWKHDRIRMSIFCMGCTLYPICAFLSHCKKPPDIVSYCGRQTIYDNIMDVFLLLTFFIFLRYNRSFFSRLKMQKKSAPDICRGWSSIQAKKQRGKLVSRLARGAYRDIHPRCAVTCPS